MRQRLRARELWLFAPFLLIIAGAFYWARLEKVEPPNAQGIIVSDFKVEPSPGMWRDAGFSDQITVTLSYRGQRPKWWGNPTNYQNPIGAFQTSDFQFGPGKNDPVRSLAFGGTLFFTRNGKKVAWKSPNKTSSFDGRFFGDKYTFVHQVSLAQAPQKLGEIGFRGLYVIGVQEPFAVERTLRAAGETSPPTAATSRGIQLLDVDATGFYPMKTTGKGGVISTVQSCYIRFTLRDFEAPPAGEKLPTMTIYDITFQDANGRKYQPNFGSGFEQTWAPDWENQQLLKGKRSTVIGVEMAPNFVTVGRLKCRGKISIGKNQPVSFDVTLPPRQPQSKRAGSADLFPVRLWHNGVPVETR